MAKWENCMRLYVVLFVFIGVFVMNALAGHELFYIGGSQKDIYVGKLDAETGKIGKLVLAAPATNPTFLAQSPDGKYLYAALETSTGAVGAFRVKADGKLEAINEQPAGAGETTHVSVSPTGQHVFVANYSGSIAVFPVTATGGLAAATAFIPFKDSSKQCHAHSIYTDPLGRFVYACDLGTDEIHIFKYNAEEGSLTPTDPPFVKVSPGSGPRHLVMNDHFLYVVNEMSQGIDAFSRDTVSGLLTPLQTMPLLPSGSPDKSCAASEIALHPSGKWLYAATRGADSITVFSVGVDGKLTTVQNVSAGVKIPRNFALDPSGAWLIAAGQKDNRLAVLKIDSLTGKLSATSESAKIAAPACVLFLRK